MKSLNVRSIFPHADAVSMPSKKEKYIASKWLKKRLKKELNLSFETASRSAKDCTPRRKIALSSALSCRAHVRSPHCAICVASHSRHSKNSSWPVRFRLSSDQFFARDQKLRMAPPARSLTVCTSTRP